VLAVTLDMLHEGLAASHVFLMGAGSGVIQAPAGIHGLLRGTAALFPSLTLGAHGIEPAVADDALRGGGSRHCLGGNVRGRTRGYLSGWGLDGLGG
jgi:hypothetical protein